MWSARLRFVAGASFAGVPALARPDPAPTG